MRHDCLSTLQAYGAIYRDALLYLLAALGVGLAAIVKLLQIFA
jgi:hypothetical protein